jgi:hypothetical protein
MWTLGLDIVLFFCVRSSPVTVRAASVTIGGTSPVTSRYIDRCLGWLAWGAKGVKGHHQRRLASLLQFLLQFSSIRGGSYTSSLRGPPLATPQSVDQIGSSVITAASAVCRQMPGTGICMLVLHKRRTEPGERSSHSYKLR